MRFARRTVLQAAAAALALPACQSSLSSPPLLGSGPMAVTRQGLRAEVDVRAHRLVIIGPEGRRTVGGLGLQPGQLNGPSAIVGLGERFYVVERGNHRVQAFDARGDSVGVFEGPGFLYSAGLAVLGEQLLVADTLNARLVLLDPRTGDSRVLVDTGLSAPTGLAVDGDRVLVADPGLRAVVELDASGRQVRTLGADWVMPRGVAIDQDLTFVADAAFSELVVLDRDGRFERTIGVDRSVSSVSLGADGRLVLA